MSYLRLVLVLAAGAAAALGLLALGYRALKAAHAGPGHHAGPGTGPRAGDRRRPGDRLLLRLVTGLIRASLRLGVRFGPMMMLTLPGRRSGVPRTNPIDLWTDGDRRFLVATHTGTAAWVRNLRAAGGGVLWRGRRRWEFTAVELSAEEGAAILRDVLAPRMRRPVAGAVLRQTVRVPPGSPLADYVAAAAAHPVFEVALAPPRTTTSQGDAMSTRIRKIPAVVIAAGLLVVLGHATLALGGVLGTSQWVSGVALGLLIAGIGNHIRIFGRR